MATNNESLISDEEDIDSDQQYDLQRTIMFGQFSRLSDFAKSYGEGLRRRAESDVSGGSTSARTPRSRLYTGRRRVKKYCISFWGAFKRVILPNIAEWLYLIALAVLMAVLSYLLDLLIEQFGTAHQKFFRLSDHVLGQYCLWVLFSVVFVLFSVGLCQIISVNALGSGIPEMKTILRGIELHDYLQFRTLIAKIVGLAAVVGSSIPVGKEGPFVHISSILAHQMGKLITRFNKSIYNEGHNYELLAAACALGVSSNFAAPIGGVLFSIEVTSTYFAVRNYWRGFFAAVIGAFLFRLISVWFTPSEVTITALFKTSFAIDFPFDVYELPVFALIGLLCGLLAALFVYFHRKCVLWLRKYRKKLKILDKSVFIYPTLVTVVITTVTFPGGTGQYLGGEVTQRQSIDHFFSNITWRTIKDISILNEDSQEFAIANYWGHPSYMIFVTLSLFLVTRFVFTAFANTLPVPAGVFFPVFILGAALGRLVGEITHVIFNGYIKGSIEVGGYAVVGAAAMAGGVTHTISTSVIVFELTGQITHILPVMIAVLIANAIANLLQPSFYDSIILIKSLPFLPDLKLSKSYNLFAKDFMRRKNLFYISHQTTYGKLQELLQEEPHSSYPLIDHPDTKVLLGSVRRDVLTKMLRSHMKPVRDHKRRILANTTGDEQDAIETIDLSESSSSRTQVPVFYRHFRHSIVNTLRGEERGNTDGTDIQLPDEMSRRISFPTELVNLEADLLSKPIDLENIQIDPSPFQLVEKTSLYKAHSLFALLGLSHSFVTSNGRLVGVVTLDDLVNAIRLGNEIKNDPLYAEPQVQELNPLVVDRAAERELDTSSNDSN